MSETRDLGVPVLVVLAGLGVLGWDAASGATVAALLAGVVGVVGGGGALLLTLRKQALRSTFLAVGCLLLLAALAPPFAQGRAAWVPWGIGALAVAFHVRRLPMGSRIALLAAAGVLAVLGAVGGVTGREPLHAASGVLLAAAFGCALNVFTSRPRPEAPPPVGPTIGFFGGSFDPFHAGHRAICEAALKVVNRLLVVVAARPPHKQDGRDPTPFHHRVAMSRLGVEGLPRTEVLEIEGRRDGPSYTVDTLEALRKLYPAGTTFRLILGGDSLQDFPLWHDWEGILERASLLVAARPGSDVEPPPEFEGRNAPITVLEMGEVNVSSTEIRRRIEAGEGPGSLLTPAVAAYVRDHALYQPGVQPSGAEEREASGAPEASPGGPATPPEGESGPASDASRS